MEKYIGFVFVLLLITLNIISTLPARTSSQMAKYPENRQIEVQSKNILPIAEKPVIISEAIRLPIMSHEQIALIKSFVSDCRDYGYCK